MRSEFIIFNVSHYDMGENRGVSVRVLGGKTQTNNKFGLDISDAKVPDYRELRELQSIPAEKFPIKVSAEFSLVSIKGSNGKEQTGIALSDIQYVNSMQLVDIKEAVTTK